MTQYPDKCPTCLYNPNKYVYLEKKAEEAEKELLEAIWIIMKHTEDNPKLLTKEVYDFLTRNKNEIDRIKK